MNVPDIAGVSTIEEGVPIHAHDRTLLAKLGFGDPDKREPIHDLICRYLGTWEASERLARVVYCRSHRREFRKVIEVGEGSFDFQGTYGLAVERVMPNYEVAISKGRGEYKTTIGFMDIVIDVEALLTGEGEIRPVGDPDAPGIPHTATSEPWFKLAVEVKVTPVGACEILRQINLYREYFNYSTAGVPVHWVTAMAFDPAPEDVEMLKGSGITPFRMGDAFDDWVEARRETGRSEDAARCLVI